MPKIGKLKIFADGASPGNPGPSGIAFTIKNEKNKIIFEDSEPVGFGTNIEAEYRAIIKSLEKASTYCDGEILVFNDSETPIKQINGKYKVKEEHLKPLFEKVKKLENKFQKVTFKNLTREDPRIKRVDALAKNAAGRNL